MLHALDQAKPFAFIQLGQQLYRLSMGTAQVVLNFLQGVIDIYTSGPVIPAILGG